jgi:predicted DNA-binding transcriptional regulator YafY
MPKENYLSRYSHIVKRLERGPATFQDIALYLEKQSEIEDINLVISQRTFQRDIKEIYTMFGYDIQNEQKGDKRYYIADVPEQKQHSLRLLESYQIMHALQNARGYEKVVLLEKRQSRGIEHFTGLLYAINEKKSLAFEYTKFQDDIVTKRVVHPLALKEAQGRWYLIAVDTKDNRLKTFGLDRMDGIDIHKTSFKAKYQYDLNEYFRHAFGINTESQTEPATVRLSFNYEQGQYIKSFPLHESQQILVDNENGVEVKLTIYITWDFVKELLSFGPNMKVLYPISLKNELKALLTKTLKLYS